MQRREVIGPGQPVNYALLSLFQYIASVLVILVHCQRLFEHEALHFIQKSMFGRMAVPFFLISSAYFFRLRWKREPQAVKLTLYIKGILKVYSFWSLVYLPYALTYFQSLHLPLYLAPLAILAALLYVGMSYHLWYIPAFLLGLLLVHFLYRKLGSKKTFVLLLVLYALGAIETYHAYLAPSLLTDWYDAYAKLFFTSRNGLFYTPIFIYLGYFLADYGQVALFQKKRWLSLLLASLFLVGEGVLVYIRQGLDKNFFFALIPFTLFLFNWLLKAEWKREKNWRHLKDLSILYFFLHPIFIELSFFLLKSQQLIKWETGRWVFFLTIILTHLTSELVIRWRGKKNRKEEKV